MKSSFACFIKAMGIFTAVFVLLMPAGQTFARDSDKSGFFPKDELFDTIIADPKEPRFFFGAHRYDNDMRSDFTGAAIGIGESFGLYRKYLGNEHAWQLSINGGLFSHFDLDTSSYDLLNSDYTVGLLWTYRYHSASLRMRLYHQSSHLGDDYAKENPEMLETHTGFDFEAAEILASYDLGQQLRIYGGGWYFLQRDPDDLDRWGYQGGFEFRGSRQVLFAGVPVFGLDIKGMEERGWTPAYSIKTGFKFHKSSDSTRDIKIMAEYYNGFIPFGPFYEYDMESYGLGIYFGF